MQIAEYSGYLAPHLNRIREMLTAHMSAKEIAGVIYDGGARAVPSYDRQNDVYVMAQLIRYISRRDQLRLLVAA